MRVRTPEMPARRQIDQIALIADDDPGMRDVLRSLLNEAGYTVIAAASGEEALNLAEHLDAAVAIVDLAMPNGDGVHTCRALRQMEVWQHVPILILTNHHTDKALHAARMAGATAFVCKPFIPSVLLRRIASLTGQGGVGIAAAPMVWTDRSAQTVSRGDPLSEPIVWEKVEPARPDERFSADRAVLQAYRNADPGKWAASAPRGPRAECAEPRHLRVLVAEDEQLTREIVVHILTQEGYRVDHAGNGQEALAAVIRGRYDLVLMDVNMPGLSGIETARTIRSLQNQKARVPIVAMTANAFHLYAEEMRVAGMNGYQMKPINPSALISCVREHLGGDSQGIPCRSGPRVRTLDLELLTEEARHFAPGAIRRFLQNLTASIGEILPLAQGWANADPVDVKHRLHNLAGVAGTLGCTRLSVAARALEAAEAVNDQLVNQFVEAADASLEAIQEYLA